MTKPIADWNEHEVEAHAVDMLRGIGITMIAPYKTRIGRRAQKGEHIFYYEPDAIGTDGASIVVTEFKAKRTKEIIGQLLIYCHVVEETARALGIALPVRGIAASTYVDENWIAVARQLGEKDVRDITVLAVVRDDRTGVLSLVAPGGDVGWVRNAAGPVNERTKLIDALRAAFGDRGPPV